MNRKIEITALVFVILILAISLIPDQDKIPLTRTWLTFIFLEGALQRLLQDLNQK